MKDPAPSSPRLSITSAMIWLLALGLAFLLDAGIRSTVAKHAAPGLVGIIDKDSPLARIIRAPGLFYTTLAIAAVLTITHPWKWRAGGLLCLSGILAGLGYVILKFLTGRQRPDLSVSAYDFHPFKGGLRFLYDAPSGLSFPSGHTCLTFATAASLAFCLPRYRWLFYGLAAVVAIERVLENTHYLSDVVAGALVGIASLHLTLYLAGVFSTRKSAPTHAGQA